MHAGEPDLLNPCTVLLTALIPKDGMKRAAFIVQRQGVIGALDDLTKVPVPETEWIDVEIDCVLKFIDGKTVCANRIPQADKREIWNSPPVLGHLIAAH